MRKVLVALLAVLGLASAQKLVLASWGSQEEIQAYQQVLRVFQETNPGIQVEYINIPSNEYLAKITAMMAAGSPPNVFFINNIDFPGLASRGVLRPLDPFIQRDKYPTGDIFPGILKAFQWEGVQYGLPCLQPGGLLQPQPAEEGRPARSQARLDLGRLPALRQGPHRGEGRQAGAVGRVLPDLLPLLGALGLVGGWALLQPRPQQVPAE